MRGTLSPILSHLAQTTIAAVGEKEKLTRLINKYRKMLRFVTGGLNISEVRFGLADLLITRDDQNDWSEAKGHYEFVLQNAPYGYLRSAAMIGKAELSVRATEPEDIEEAIERAQKAYKNLLSLVGPSDFYSIKCLVVEAELRLKRNNASDKKAALKLFDKIFRDEMADDYFRARAMVGHAELMLWEKKKDINKEIQLCHAAIDLLGNKSDDYFSIKSKILQGEYIVQRMAHYDKSRAIGIFMGVISNKNADIDLVARAKLNLADLHEKPKAMVLVKEVLSSKIGDEYLVERAKGMKKKLESIK